MFHWNFFREYSIKYRLSDRRVTGYENPLVRIVIFLVGYFYEERKKRHYLTYITCAYRRITRYVQTHFECHSITRVPYDYRI